MNIPSFSVRPGDVIELTDGLVVICASRPPRGRRGRVASLGVDRGGRQGRKGRVQGPIRRADLPPSISEGLVVELYSR